MGKIEVFLLFFFFMDRSKMALQQLMTQMHRHAQNLGMTPPPSCTNKKMITLFLQCPTVVEWKKFEWKQEKKPTLILLCEQHVPGFKKMDARKSKEFLIGLLMSTQKQVPAPNTPKVDLSPKKISSPKTKHPLENLGKDVLLSYCEKHESFQKSLARQKKEKLVEFILLHKIEVSLPTKPLAKMTKKELLEECMTRQGFDQKTHGKTKTTLLTFLGKPIEKEEVGCSPVNIQTLLENPEDPEVLKKKILHVLMNTSPFQDYPDLEKKVTKLV